MDTERSLETILQELRAKARVREALPKTKFNQYHRQFLDQLRHGDWVASAKLPDTPKAKLTLLRNGWIETRGTTSVAEYRITPSGLAEVCRPR